MPHPIPFEQFKLIYSQVTRLSVDLLVLTPNGIALTKRAIPPGEGNWHIPGGTVIYGESVEEALMRIGQEELGIKIRPLNMVGYIEYREASAELGWGWPIALVFTCDYVDGEFQGSDQGEEIDYFKHIPDNILSDQAQFLNRSFKLEDYYLHQEVEL